MADAHIERNDDDNQSVESFYTAVAEDEAPGWERLGNCFGSDCIWVTFCASIFIIFILVVYITEAGMGNKNAPYIYLMALMFFSALSQVYCLRKRRSCDLVLNVAMDNSATGLYVTAGLYMFAAGTLMSILLKLSLFLHSSLLLYDCFEDNNEPHTSIKGNIFFQNDNSSSSNTSLPTTLLPLFIYGGYCRTLVAYNIFRLLFVLIQLAFIHVFRRAHFRRLSWVKLSLYHTLLTNICVWFKYVSDETGLFGTKEQATPSIDSFVITAESLKDKLNPFVLEFSLIAAGIFINISSNMRDAENGEGVRILDELPNRHGYHERARDMNNPGSSFRTQPGLLVGGSCGLMLVALAIMFDNSDNKLSEKSKVIFLCYEILLSVIQSFVIVVAVYYLVKEHREEDHSYNKWDYFLLAAAYLGTLVFDFVVLYGVSLSIAKHSNNTFADSIELNPMQSRDDILVAILTICLFVFHMVQMFTIVVYFRKYWPRFNCNSTKYIRQFILFLITTNLGSWALDSFIEIKNHVTVPYYSPSLYFKGWQTVLALCFPLCVFFRFHSALLLFEFWQRFRYG